MQSDDVTRHVTDPVRLAALRSVALLDTPAEMAFDRLCWLASRFLNAPVALVSLVDSDRQFFKSCIGLPEPLRSMRETPLSYSFCKHNRIADQAMVIDDARLHPELKDNLAIRDLNVIAYLGFPLTTADGYVLGSFCVTDSQPREWTEENIQVIRELATSVMTEIQLRTEVATRRQAEHQRDDFAELNEQLRQQITARKQAELQQRSLESQLLQTQKLDAIGRLAGGIAHDLNNLLAPILGYSELLSERLKQDEKLQGYAREIMLSGERARDLIRQLLAYSRKQNLEFRPININSVIENFSSLLKRTIPEDIKIITRLSSNLHPVMADVTQLEQIIMNLALNAADAMPSGGTLTFNTRMRRLDDNVMELPAGIYVELNVTDTGSGMDSDTSSHAFEPFYTTKGDKGTGLGLATVFGIVKQHGGHINFNTSPNNGTTFTILLPITERTPVADLDRPAAASQPQGSETILVVEDNPQLQQMVQTILQLQGYRVLSAADGKQALSVLKTFPGNIDLLLTDVVMPGMNGRMLYEKAVHLFPELKVLYMSGYNDHIIENRGLSNEHIRFIQKPFSTGDLAKAIRQILDEDEK